MTERLYYANSYVTEFDAHVEEIVQFDGRPALILGRTHFYPTSGGRSHDTGTLNGFRVVDVSAQDGSVLHVIDCEPGAGPESMTGQDVHGVIDWERRYDHMQQHSGQHLLSQVFYQLFGYETVSVHFGDLESTLDLDVETVSREQLEDAEKFANQQVYANLSISARFITDAEIDQVPLRRPPKVTGDIRVVEIEDFDYSACGGTHCRRTGELGPIKFVRQTRQNHKARMTFLCGWRALADYSEKHQIVMQAASLYNNDYRQTPDLIARSLEEARSLQRRVNDLTAELLPYEVAEMRKGAHEIGGLHVISQVFDDRDIDAVKQMASALTETPGYVVLMGVVFGGKLTLVFARSQDVALHAGNLLKETLADFGGGGGGRPEFAQGGGAPAEQANEALAFARSRLGS